MPRAKRIVEEIDEPAVMATDPTVADAPGVAFITDAGIPLKKAEAIEWLDAEEARARKRARQTPIADIVRGCLARAEGLSVLRDRVKAGGAVVNLQKEDFAPYVVGGDDEDEDE
jgi:hypothetical protein